MLLNFRRTRASPLVGDKFCPFTGDWGPIATTGKLDGLIGPGEMRNGLRNSVVAVAGLQCETPLVLPDERDQIERHPSPKPPGIPTARARVDVAMDFTYRVRVSHEFVTPIVTPTMTPNLCCIGCNQNHL